MTHQFEDVLRDYGALLSRVASSYEANEAIRQELLQEIALAVWQGLSRYKGDSSIKTYILKIAHNRGVSHVASQVRHQHVNNNDDAIATVSDPVSSPEHASQQFQMLSSLLAVIRELPLPQRQVMTLSLEGLSYDDIASVTGLNKSHVGVLLNRARKAVTRSIEP